MPSPPLPEARGYSREWIAECLTCFPQWDGTPHKIWHPDGVELHKRDGHDVRLRAALEAGGGEK